MDDNDEFAKWFDNFMYGLMLSHIEGKAQFNRRKKQLVSISTSFLKKVTIPQIKNKIELIKTISTDEFWENSNILILFEKVRIEFRELIKFTMEGDDRKVIYTNLQDEVLSVKEGEGITPGYTFEDYKLKVNRYIEEHRDHIAIYKLRHNIPLTQADYEDLERILTGELGTVEDYKREFKDTPFGLLVRRIAKLDHQAAYDAFSEFISDQSLNQEQIVFVRKVIDYVEKNGYIENISELMKPPFDKPQSFIKLFDSSKQKKIIETITKIKENAIKVV